MSRSRATRSRPLLLAACLLLLASCTARTDPVTSGSDRPDSPWASPSRSPSPSPTKSTVAPPGRTANPPTQASEAAPRYADRGSVGAMATAYLRRAPARELLVEVDFVEGYRPSDGAIEHLEQVLERETDKPDGVTVRVDDALPQEREEYTFEQIEALERRNRDAASARAQATLYVLYLNGDLAGEEGTLGAAYRASGAVVFQERVRSAATSLVRPGSIERAVLTHEAGHLLGLVNIGYTSRYDHEDPEHPKHSKYRDSVMYWAIEDVSVASLLTGGPPSDFGRFDRADLEARRR